MTNAHEKKMNRRSSYNINVTEYKCVIKITQLNEDIGLIFSARQPT